MPGSQPWNKPTSHMGLGTCLLFSGGASIPTGRERREGLSEKEKPKTPLGDSVRGFYLRGLCLPLCP